MQAPIRLAREIPAGRQAAYVTAIGAVLAIVGGGFVLVARRVAADGGDDEWLAYVVGIGFSVVGILMLILGVKAYLITRLPETIVEVSRMPVRAGQPFQITVRQPGPIRLRSLRVNVVGEQITRYEVWRKGKKRIETDRRLVHQSNVVAVGNLTIGHDDEHAVRAEATVPKEVTLVDIEGDKTVLWRLEVWGRVRGWVNFGHPFVITVTGVKAVVESDL